MRPLVLGIDPGLSGAVAVLRGDSVELLEDLPVVQFSNARIKNRIDAASLAEILRPFAGEIGLAVVGRTAARPGEAPSGSYSFGYTSGVIAGVLGTLQIPVTLPMPAVWKRAMSLSPDKNLSRSRAIELYPAIAPKLSRIKDHDRAEAVLMARYGQKLAQQDA